MALQPGGRLGAYEIVDLIGKGGMGEVYRAKDTKLKRQVALKVLPAALSRDPERIARFHREAEVLASLNHPNIAALYGLEESDGMYALVMELVEGEDLKSPQPVSTALDYAKQIADALEYAHEMGVMHRDLKPANIKVTPEGRVKLLDFGLAKAIEDPVPHPGDPELSPTLALGATKAGMILGTAAYMSPEQASGNPADRRADIFSFGAVFYEMLAGKRAFTGTSVSDILATVLKVDPDWTLLPADTPPGILKLIQRCLRKERRQRLQAIGDARFTIEEVIAGGAGVDSSISASAVSSAATAAAQAPSRSGHLGWIGAGVVLLAAVVAGFLYFRQQPPVVGEPVRLAFSIPEKTAFTGGGGTLAVSPDGRRVLFTAVTEDGARRIYVRTLDTQESRAVMGTEDVLGVPFWSTDSKTIGFGDGAKLKKIDATGGPAQVVCDSPGLVGGGYWTADGGTIIFGTAGGNGSGPIFRVPTGGGTRAALTTVDRSRKETFHAHPSPLPDGKRFLYVRSSADNDGGGIYVGSIDAKPDQQESKRLLADQASPVYVPATGRGNGYLLFRRDGTLLAQPFDADDLKLAGDATPIAEQIASSGRFGVFAVSNTGVLAYRTAASLTTQITWLDRQGKVARVVDSTTSPSFYAQIALSPDGSKVVAARSADIGNPSAVDLWMIDLARSGTGRFTFDPTTESNPRWSHDGGRIAFSSNRNGTFDLYWKASNGTGSEELLLKSGTPKRVADWSPDGRFLLYQNEDPKTKGDLWVLPITPQGPGGAPMPVVQGEFNEGQGQFSPDGRWIAYVSDESGKFEIYVQPFPLNSGGGGRWMVSSGGGAEPHWRRDGKALYYLGTSGRTLMETEIASGPVFKAGVPHALFDAPLAVAGNLNASRWDIAPDGQRFLTITNPPGDAVSSSINMVLNWQAGLKK